MKELAPNIFYVPGKNDSRFPYCACLYLRGKTLRVLIDAGMGSENMAAVKEMGIDLLILTHCHIDHRLTRREIPDIPVWCHESEAIYLKDREYFFTSMGLTRSGLDIARHFKLGCGTFDIIPDHTMVDGERIDLGELTLETIHTPGHTPGHLAFFIPEHDLLFAGDIDLTSFGPFYGHDFADIADFLVSIDKLKRIDAKIAVSGHAGPFNSNLDARFDRYKQVVFDRDHLLLDKLTRPRTVESFKGSHIFYKTYPGFAELIRWFELVHIEKHLSRLEVMGKVRKEDNTWLKA